MKSLITVLIYVFFTFNACTQSQEQVKINSQSMEELYKSVKFKVKQVHYDMKILNGTCNYKIWINDMPVYLLYNNVKGEISIPINGKILKSGKQRLKIQIFPFYDKNRKNLNDKLSEYAGLDVEIREMEWDSVSREFNYYPVFNYRTPRSEDKSLLENNVKLLLEEDQQYYEEEVIFEVTVPYTLNGWSESVDLRSEDQEKLMEEVELYYKEIRNDFKDKKLKSIAEKYFIKEREVAQCFFHDKEQAKTRWNDDILEEIINPTANLMELKEYEMEFFGDGKIVSLMRFPGKSPLCIITKKDDGNSRYSVYDIFLHRPKPGAPLEMIR